MSDENNTPVLDEVKPELKKPSKYQVYIMNDDYTPMDFVTLILMHVFNKPEPIAEKIMMDIHESGRGICGEFTRDIAETKVDVVTSMSKESGYPLLCDMAIIDE